MTAVVEAESLTKRFAQVSAVTDLSFALEAGTITGFLGPNGAGKTTTLRMVVASTGGASSPLRASQLFFVVFAAWFMPRRTGIHVLGSAVTLTLVPLVYDSHALSGSALGWTIMLVLTFLVVGVTIVTARARLESLRDRARKDSFQDPLTGVANRRAVDRYFRATGRQRRESDRFGVVLIDLDHFKQVNTRGGHAGGDRALSQARCAMWCAMETYWRGSEAMSSRSSPRTSRSQRSRRSPNEPWRASRPRARRQRSTASLSARAPARQCALETDGPSTSC